MRKVVSIGYKEKRMSKEGKAYTITHVTVDSGDETYEFYGDDVRVGDLVQVMHDARWNKNKVRKSP